MKLIYQGSKVAFFHMKIMSKDKKKYLHKYIVLERSKRHAKLALKWAREFQKAGEDN